MTEERHKLIEVRNLRKYFPIRRGTFGVSKKVVKAVDGVSFYIYQGETFGLVGESGSGKTTTGRMILRAYEPCGLTNQRPVKRSSTCRGRNPLM